MSMYKKFLDSDFFLASINMYELIRVLNFFYSRVKLGNQTSVWLINYSRY